MTRSPTAAIPDRADGGAVTVELVLLTPLLVALLCLVTGLGRIALTRSQLHGAAADAARAASRATSHTDAVNAARRAARADLQTTGVHCPRPDVQLNEHSDPAGRLITVSVSCRLALGDVALAGLPGTVHLTGRATSPVDRYAAGTP